MAEPAYRTSKHSGGDWPAPGEWTYEDYLRLPDDGNRYEVIRGFLYVTAAPTWEHQDAGSELESRMRPYVWQRQLGVVVRAPFDIKLPGIASPVQPDLVFFRAGNTPQPGVSLFEGVPDLVVEILSPSTRRRDRTVKLQAYQEAGIPEYWMVDPDARTVAVYVLEPGTGYTEACRGGVGEAVGSSVLPGFRLEVAGLFPRQS